MKKYILIVDDNIIDTFWIYECAKIYAMCYDNYTIVIIDMD